MRSTRGKVGTVALLTLSTMFLSALPAMARTSDSIEDGWDTAYASNSYSWEYGHEATAKVCDNEPDGNSVRAEVYTYDGTRYDLVDNFGGDCAWVFPKGTGKQIRSFRIREDGGGWSPLAVLDRATLR
ncbi:hypothetical protein [Allokutzneria oryzae]|uniref:Secreted protein n=1 Tax=Allokutzneria oryzae TaxID=1378989 RepID=A0ABV5ZW08_9PSEU